MAARREGEAVVKGEEASPSREVEAAGPSRGEAAEEAETCRDDQAATASVEVGSKRLRLAYDRGPRTRTRDKFHLMRVTLAVNSDAVVLSLWFVQSSVRN